MLRLMPSEEFDCAFMALKDLAEEVYSQTHLTVRGVEDLAVVIKEGKAVL